MQRLDIVFAESDEGTQPVGSGAGTQTPAKPEATSPAADPGKPEGAPAPKPEDMTVDQLVALDDEAAGELPEAQAKLRNDVLKLRDSERERVLTEQREADRRRRTEQATEQERQAEARRDLDYYERWAAKEFGTEEERAEFQREFHDSPDADENRARLHRGGAAAHQQTATRAKAEAFGELYRAAREKFSADGLDILPDLTDPIARDEVQREMQEHGEDNIFAYIYRKGREAGPADLEDRIAQAKAEAREEMQREMAGNGTGRPDLSAGTPTSLDDFAGIDLRQKGAGQRLLKAARDAKRSGRKT